jgi:hypothetical protein
LDENPNFANVMNRLLHIFPLLREFFRFAMAYKVYWIVPMVIVLALMALLISLGQISAPFIYTLF